MPAKLPLGFAVPDLHVPRARPCTAIVGPSAGTCGATPASQYRRSCPVASHGKDIWLCPVHAAFVASGSCMCRDCEIRGGVSQARIYRIVMLPVRLPK